MQTISEAAAYTLQFINQTHRSVFHREQEREKPLLRKLFKPRTRIRLLWRQQELVALNAGGVTFTHVSIAV
jgi:hypothetical protein